uniref:Integrase catalytic domain-containing protein n=1 Tax=Trichuris muris TaxID=70415 RepID=A0A5S6QU78_TRIMR
MLQVPKVQQRVGIDVTHCGGDLFLTMINCGPSRFSIWRPLNQSCGAEIVRHLESVFYERGAPEELLANNDTAFRSHEIARLAKGWGTHILFRCASAPSGNGITEQCHRTIKVTAARTRCTVREAVYRYNLMPRDNCSASTAPINMVYRYIARDWEEALTDRAERDTRCPYFVGEAVWIKPHASRCTTR